MFAIGPPPVVLGQCCGIAPHDASDHATAPWSPSRQVQSPVFSLRKATTRGAIQPAAVARDSRFSTLIHSSRAFDHAALQFAGSSRGSPVRSSPIDSTTSARPPPLLIVAGV